MGLGGERETMNPLFIMGPHPDHFNDTFFFQHLIDKAMLDVDPAGIGACQVAA